MKRKLPNGTLVWKQLDDRVVPNLHLNVVDRAVYSHLLRHSRLEGQRRLHFNLGWLAKGVRVCTGCRASGLPPAARARRAAPGPTD
jgi:hypothetical protein